LSQLAIMQKIPLIKMIAVMTTANCVRPFAIAPVVAQTLL